MSSEFGINSLYKAIKDETRKKIIRALSVNESLAYTDLMNLLKIEQTGKLNYHLKILSGLISKKENGEYFLTDKGKLASQLLSEFPERNMNNNKKVKQVWIVAGLGNIAFLLSVLMLYLFNYIAFPTFLQGLVVGAFGTVLTYFLYRAQGIHLHYGSSKERLAIKITYTLLGACICGIGTFFGGIFLISGVARALNKSSPLLGVWGSWFLIIAFVIAPLTGGLLGYLMGKKRSFQKIEWIRQVSNDQ
jgi:hypothetical protein